jgi:Photoprotection regulator fluorescence recovery protein
MNNRDFSWSPKEKKIARIAFDKAYKNEMNEIKNELEKKLQDLQDLQKIWLIHNYLSKRRKEIDRKYDYRYSVLIIVFGRLLSEGYIEEKDLEGLSIDKINAIKSLSQAI